MASQSRCIALCLRLASFNSGYRYLMGLILLSCCACDNPNPTRTSHASVSTVVRPLRSSTFRGTVIQANFGASRRKKLHSSKKERHSVGLAGDCSSLLAFGGWDAISSCRGWITCSRLSIVSMKNGRLFTLNVTPTLRKNVNLMRTWLIYFCGDLENITMSFKNARANWHSSAERMNEIKSWNLPRSLRIPNGTRRNNIVRDMSWKRFSVDLLHWTLPNIYVTCVYGWKDRRFT